MYPYPALMPTIIVTFIMNLGTLMSVGYEKIILLYNPVNLETADVISSYVYRTGLVGGKLQLRICGGAFQFRYQSDSGVCCK